VLPAAKKVFSMTQSPSNAKKSNSFLHLVDSKKDDLHRTDGEANATLEPGAIGQRAGVNNSILPTGSGERKKRNEKILKTVGIKLLGVVESNLIFQRVLLPMGWQRIAHGHGSYSCIIDEKSRKRVEIVYLDTEHNQKVYMSLCRRFRRSFDYDRFCDTNVGVTNVTDNGKVIHTTDPTVSANGSEGANAAASAWLDEHYPQWRDPSAYWD